MKKYFKTISIMLACLITLTAVLSACSSDTGSNSAAYAKESAIHTGNESEQSAANNSVTENKSEWQKNSAGELQQESQPNGDSSVIKAANESTGSYEESPYKLYVDGEKLALESAPIDRHCEEYFPINEVADAIGAKVTVDSKRSTITISKGKRKHVLHDKGDKFPIIDGVKYAPIGAIAGGLYTQIRFNREEAAVYLTTM
ncbi:stalk domain-containing protein [Paenibacillus sp. IITD108]|uniref:stalk domain-containing protein n=1 Tax=Paenibacillus sp. IITD108 TaxID=3116649 RepID=UPI002F3F68DB